MLSRISSTTRAGAGCALSAQLQCPPSADKRIRRFFLADGGLCPMATYNYSLVRQIE